MVAIKKLSDKLDLLDTFVLTGVLTVLVTRSFLKISGFPQLGNDSLHIAHVLWGGLFLVLAFLLVLLSDHVSKLFSAFLGGIGFGLFIDEIGKFITQDNDYFYEPAFMVMYVLFISIWFLSRLIVVRSQNAEFLSPAEWPKQSWITNAIYIWAFLQAFGGFVLLITIFKSGFGTIKDFLDITGVGLIFGLVYLVSVAFGIYRIYQKLYLRAAHIIRGATIFSILLVYPFIFFEYPTLGIIGILITIPVTIGLSEIRFVNLIENFYIYQVLIRRRKLK